MKDEEPDKFYYKLLGKGGSFYFMRQQNGTVVPKQVPMTGVQVTYSSGNSTIFKVVDTDGTTYLFSSAVKDQCSPKTGTTFNMSWKCDRIISASGADTISFDYVSYRKSLVKKCDGKEEVYDQIHIRSLSAPGALLNAAGGPKHILYGAELDSRMEYIRVEEDGGYTYYWEKVGTVDDLRSYQNLVINNISRIRFKNGRVEFIYNNNEVLTQIKVFAKGQTEPVRIITLNQEGSGYARTLKNLTVGKDSYSFVYKTKHEGDCFPDFWGYTNGGDFLSGSAGVPFHTVTVEPGMSGRLIDGRAFFYGSVDMSVGVQQAGSSMSLGTHLPYLTIKYPTGGLTIFHCEPHYYRCSSGVYYDQKVRAGGWRIKQVDYFDMDTTLVKQKIYKYGPNEDGCGVLRREPTFDEEYGTCHTCQEVRYYSPYLGSYSLDATARLRTYLPNTIYQLNYSDGSCINYNEVAEYNKDMGAETGKIVYKYNLDNRYGMMRQYADPIAPYPIGDDAWWVGVPDSTIYYKYNGGRYDWVKRIGYQYDYHMEPDRIFQGRVWRGTIAVLIGGESLTSDFIRDYNEFTYRTSAIKIGCVRLTQEEESIRNDDGSIQTTQTRLYYDNPNHYLPGRKVTTYPTGDVVTEQSLFLEDYLQDSYTQSLQMRNLVELPMERIVRRNGKIISGESYCYDFYGRITSGYLLETDILSESLFRLSNKNTAGEFGPTGTAAYRLDSSYKQRATILYDEDDNICQILSPGKRPVCYLWGYNGHYLIAEIRNATYEEIQHKLGGILLNRVRKAVVPSDTDLARINGLRADKNLLVTTATYRPLYGMISQTDPDGHSKSYEYNSETGRLLQIKDGDGNIETQYSYSQDL